MPENVNEQHLDDLRPDVREYLLRWKEYAYAAALTLVMTAWLVGQLRFARLCGGETIARGLLVGMMYAAAAAAKLLSAVAGASLQKQMATLSLTLFSCVCPIGLLTSRYLPLQMALFGLAGGAAVLAVMREAMRVRQLRTKRSDRSLLAVSLGLAGGLSAMAYPLWEYAADEMPGVIFLLAAGALGIHLKFRKNPYTPIAPLSVKSLELPYFLRAVEPSQRVEKGVCFLTAAIGGALLTFAMPEIPYGSAMLLLLVAGVSFGAGKEISIIKMAAGGFAAALCGVAALWYPIGRVGLIGFALGAIPVCCQFEKSLLKRQNTVSALIEIDAAILVGTVLAGICLSIK